MFQKNVGGLDKVVRIVVGLGLFIAGIISNIWWLYVLGGVVFLTGAVGRCGFYKIFGINTNKKCSCSGDVCSCGNDKKETPHDSNTCSC